MTTTAIDGTFGPRTDGDAAVEVRGLHRRYGKGAQAHHAVRGVDLDVRPGQVTALLGTNGAGKTSTLEVIEGLAAPSEGTVRVLGLDPVADRDRVRPRLGVLLQRSGFPGDLTVREVLQLWHDTTTGARPVDEALDQVRLGERAGVRVLSLSGGEQRRLDLACTLMGRPEVVVLDEPTTGLDVERRRDVWDIVAGLRDHGTAVLFSTHHLEEVEELADEVAILHQGQISRRGSVAEVVEGHPASIRFATPYDASGSPRALPPLPGDLTRAAGRGRDAARSDAVTTLRTQELQTALHRLLGWAEAEQVRLEQLRAENASLESVFLEIAGHQTATDPVETAPEETR